MIIGRITAAGVVRHRHVALKVQFAAMDGTAVNVGAGIAGNLKLTGEGCTVSDIDRAAVCSLTAGDAAINECCFCDLPVQIYAAAIAPCDGILNRQVFQLHIRCCTCPDRAAVLRRAAAFAECAVFDGCILLCRVASTVLVMIHSAAVTGRGTAAIEIGILDGQRLMGGEQRAAAVFRHAIFEGATRNRRCAAAALTADMKGAALLQGGDTILKIAVCHRDSLDFGVDTAAVMLQGGWVIAILCPAADEGASGKRQVRAIPHNCVAITKVVIDSAALFAGPAVGKGGIRKLHAGHIALNCATRAVIGT